MFKNGQTAGTVRSGGLFKSPHPNPPPQAGEGTIQ
ncbi:hypothetical protein IAD21_04189 [Abditibacteriota bacterium]|nr:hypothetical protein IAD21_04189 [Abditibacteriota bacterium]